MGLTKEVRDFFTGRIVRLLDAKLQTIYEQIDRKKVSNQAVVKLFEKIGLSADILTRIMQIEQERDRLYQEQTDIKNLVFSGIEKAFPKNNFSRYTSNSDVAGNVEDFAKKHFENEVLEELYPALVPQIKQIAHIKEDVESVVLLSTSETKLVQRLTAVLQKYGGDIQELLDYIPE
jgi:hypothetical protein